MIVARDYRGEWSTDVGGRTRSRLKVKGRHESRFVVIGLDVPLAGACSLLLASRQGRRLVYVGQVRWGVSRAVVAAIRDCCVTRGTPACSGAETRAGLVWIEPAAAAPQLGVNPRTAISFPALGMDRRDLEAQPVVRLRPRRRRTPLRA